MLGTYGCQAFYFAILRSDEMSLERTIKKGIGSPFDDDAEFRLQRMGLLSADGVPDRDAVTVLANVYAGMLFDDFCDFHQSCDEVFLSVERLLDAAEGVDIKQKFLLICLQYDSIYRNLPDPIWWISGNETLAELFTLQFLKYMTLIVQKPQEDDECCEKS
jgi:hypothetical protein